MNVQDICTSQVEMTTTFCRNNDFESAMNTINNFRSMGLKKDNKFVKATLSVFVKFETEINKRVAK